MLDIHCLQSGYLNPSPSLTLPNMQNGDPANNLLHQEHINIAHRVMHIANGPILF